MQPSPRNGLLAWLLLLGTASADYHPVHCDSLTIHSQADVDAAVGDKGCQVIDHDVVLASDATGDISLDGIDVVEGSVRSEDGSQVTALRNKAIWEIDGDLVLRGMPKLQNVNFTKLLRVGRQKQSGGELVLEDLPAVTSIDLYELYGFAEFHAVDLPRLDVFRQRRIPTDHASTLEFRNCGPHANLQTLTLLDAEDDNSYNIDHLTISDFHTDPDVPQTEDDSTDFGVILKHNHTARLDLDLDGDAAAWIRSEHVDRAHVSGVRKLWVDGDIDELVVRNSSLAAPFRPRSVASLDLQNCSDFERFAPDYVGNSWFDWTAPLGSSSGLTAATKGLVLRNLPRMYLHPTTTHLQNSTDVDGAGNDRWYNGYCTGGGGGGASVSGSPSARCMGNFTTVVLEGNITNAFFEDFLWAFWSPGVPGGNSFWDEEDPARHPPARARDRALRGRVDGPRLQLHGHGRVAGRRAVSGGV
ncbi:hypothetical protein PG994_002527 [Apiospora phragmitis]|uniref:Receptor L-domain domain-containing protein n=1 Tax=Apiospora phragmitis TaxID=2905665 RepID=A0ABR1W5G9_9PEZI